MPEEDERLIQLVKEGKSWTLIAAKLKRGVTAVRERMYKLRKIDRLKNIRFGWATKVNARGDHLNDDKSPLIDLLSCIVCREKMRIEKSSPDAEGRDIIQYRCGLCGGIERVRLFRRSRDAAA
jgi:Myb-like DNA-binding domain